jgi:hypothetical protein
MVSVRTKGVPKNAMRHQLRARRISYCHAWPWTRHWARARRCEVFFDSVMLLELREIAAADSLFLAMQSTFIRASQ